MVPRGRIGLPTQRFSVSCSTTELPWHMVGVDGLEPSTSPLSEVRSNQLSYTPIYKKNFLARMLINIQSIKSSLFQKFHIYENSVLNFFKNFHTIDLKSFNFNMVMKLRMKSNSVWTIEFLLSQLACQNQLVCSQPFYRPTKNGSG